MKVTPAAEFAVRGICVLAKQNGNGPVNLATICEKHDLSKQYLAKIFGTLARAGLVTPVRGKHGGYLLARRPDEITVLDVIEAVEGPIALNFCQHSPPRCDQTDCPLRPVWAELQDVVSTRLASVTFQSLLDGCAD